MYAKMPAPVRGLSSLIEPLYAAGHVLMDDDLSAGVSFTRNLSRLLFRSLFGCGVICGYGVLPKVECERLKVTVLPGVALDCCGDPIEMRTCETLSVGEECGEKLPSHLWVMVRRRQHACAPRELACPSDDEDDACGCHATRSRAGFELKVTDQEPKCVCQCPDPPKKPPKGERQPEQPAPPPPPPVVLESLGRRRSDLRAHMARLNERMVTAGVDLKEAQDKVLAANAALKAARAQPAAKGEAATQKAAKVAELTSAVADASQRQEDLFAQVEAMKAEFGQAVEDVAHVEHEWHSATGGAAQAEMHRSTLADSLSLIAPTDCHKDHYAGVCGCCCDGDCDGWVVLAEITPPDPLVNGSLEPDAVDYGVRRFIRPVLAADPYLTNPPTTDTCC